MCLQPTPPIRQNALYHHAAVPDDQCHTGPADVSWWEVRNWRFSSGRNPSRPWWTVSGEVGAYRTVRPAMKVYSGLPRAAVGGSTPYGDRVTPDLGGDGAKSPIRPPS
jgi:hypothetical protein